MKYKRIVNYFIFVYLLCFSVGCKKINDELVSQDKESAIKKNHEEAEDMSNKGQEFEQEIEGEKESQGEKELDENQKEGNNHGETIPNRYKLTIDGANVGIDISDILYGLFYEDINLQKDSMLFGKPDFSGFFNA